MKKIKSLFQKENTIYYILFGALLMWISFLCIYKLGIKYVDPWDEARHGVNAYEMLHGKHLWVNTYLYETDLYNLKPPLSMWCQAFSFLILGSNTVSLRLYSALCYILLCVICGTFVWRHHGKLAAVIVLGLLSANTTPFAAHMIRSGDADSLYVLLFTLAMIFMLKIQEKMSNLYLCGLFFAFAFLTKSYHAGIIAVIGFVYLVATGLIKKMKLMDWVKFLIAILLPILIWAVPRFFVDGITFFREMILTDVLGRTDGTLNNNKQPFGWYASYYLGTMSGKLTIYLWALMVDIAAVFGFSIGMNKEKWEKQKHFWIGYGLWILVPFLAFSGVTNKLLWYVYPVSIPLFILCAVGLSKLMTHKALPKCMSCLALILCCITIFIYTKDVYQTIQTQTTQYLNEFQCLLKDTGKEFAKQKDAKRKIYVEYAADEAGNIETKWAGQDVFVAEAYGDFYCVNGGFEAMIADKDSGKLVIVSKSEQEKVLNQDKDLVPISSSENYVVILLK